MALKNQEVRFWCIYTTKLELALSKIPKKIQTTRPATHTALPRRKIALPLREKSARAKQKNDKAIFLFGSVLTNRATGLRFGSRAKSFPPFELLHALPARYNRDGGVFETKLLRKAPVEKSTGA